MIRENAAPSEVRQAPLLAMLLCLGALALLGAHSLGHLRFEDLLQGRPHQCSQKLLVLRQNGFDVDRSRLAFLFLAACGLATGLAFKTTGDGLLVEFASVVDAVRCAAEVQRAMAERSAEVPEARRIAFRVGINLGEVRT
jgi:class 3 adenylate cyclase